MITTRREILAAIKTIGGLAGQEYVWGEAISWHTIGPYEFLAFHPNKYRQGVCTNEVNRSVIDWHAWVSTQDTCHSCGSLDAALAHAIAYRAEGPNTRADTYFLRAIGRERNPDDAETIQAAKELGETLGWGYPSADAAEEVEDKAHRLLALLTDPKKE